MIVFILMGREYGECCYEPMAVVRSGLLESIESDYKHDYPNYHFIWKEYNIDVEFSGGVR